MLAMGQPNYTNGFELTLQPHMLEVTLKSCRVFVNSMSDLFHLRALRNSGVVLRFL